MPTGAGTFRDPTGSLIDVDGRILRGIRRADAAEFGAVVQSQVVRSLVERGALVRTRSLPRDQVPNSLQALDFEWYEHDRVGFVSVPAEWSAAMLAHAARHTIDVCLELLRHGYILKDATPANILFDGAKPVLVDVPSIEQLDSSSGLWLARHQFETTFLLPLLASIELGYPLHASLADPARGLSHEQLARLYGLRRWCSLARIRHVALAAALGHADLPRTTGAAGRQRAGVTSPQGREKARFVLQRSLSSLGAAVDDLERTLRRRNSHWSAYAATRAHYADSDLVLKRAFVERVLAAARPNWVLDIGANTGEFCEMAAARASTVGIDLDEVSVSAIHSRAMALQLPVQALVVDLSQPTPASGWRNEERKSFFERAAGRFDIALMLAVGHHLRVSAGIPLSRILQAGLELGGGSLVFEFVPTTDPMFRAIARGREALYADNTVENCEALLQAIGTIEMRENLHNGRTLFWVQAKPVQQG
jgi:SAM-dependent methyltransferase